MTTREPSTVGVSVADNEHNRYYVKLARRAGSASPDCPFRLVARRQTLRAGLLFLVSVIATPQQFSQTFIPSIRTFPTHPSGKVAPAMPTAPLRLITFRKLQVFNHYRGFPRLFNVVESLECGHTSISHTWEFLDLVNAYTDNSDVSARRRRCHVCARLLSHTQESGVAHGREAEVYRNAPADHRRDSYSNVAASVG